MITEKTKRLEALAIEIKAEADRFNIDTPIVVIRAIRARLNKLRAAQDEIINSMSFDEVIMYFKRAGEMAKC
jgi:hypothetical protein